MNKLIVFLLLIGVGYLGYQQYQKSQGSALEPLYDLPYVAVYGKTNCNWTQKCLRELKAEGIDPIFENIDDPDLEEEMFERIDEGGLPRNQIVIPVIDVNGNIVVGYQSDKIFAFYDEYEE